MTNNTPKDKVTYLPLNSIQPNPLQPRGTILPDSLHNLVDSIKHHGVLEPLIVAQTPAGYQIIAGERRWRAAKLAGLQEVPVVIKKTTPKGMLEMAIVENVQRADLNPIERAKAFHRLMREFGLTNSDIAKRIGKSPAYVSNTLKLLELPDALKDGLIGGLITEGHARALSGIRNPRLMIEAYKMVLREGASVRRAEEIARTLRKAEERTHNYPKRPGRKPAYVLSEKVKKMRDKLQEYLGKNSQVQIIRTRRQTRLIIKLNGNLTATDPQLQKIFSIVSS